MVDYVMPFISTLSMNNSATLLTGSLTQLSHKTVSPNRTVHTDVCLVCMNVVVITEIVVVVVS